MQIGAYEVLGEIARGGAGVVYRARHVSHGTPAAIKVLMAQTDSEFFERFRREAHVTYRLRHPHVVGLLEWGLHQRYPYLVLELIEGRSLEDLVREQGPLPTEQIYQIGSEIADALHYAHGLGLVHRDIKPANILIEDRTGRALLTDFGIAQVSDAATERLTVTGEVLGTPAYMSPEQALGAGEVGPPSDVYSLGATLYTAVCGRSSVNEETALAAMARVMTDAPPHPSEIYPEADPQLSQLCMDCMEKEPEDRIPNAAALRDALIVIGRLGIAPKSESEVVPAGAPSLGVVLAVAAVTALCGLGLGRLTAGGADPAPVATHEQPTVEPPPSPDEPPPDEPPPVPSTVEPRWLAPYSTLIERRQQAKSSPTWENYALLAEHCSNLGEPYLALEAVEQALKQVSNTGEARTRLTYLRGTLFARLAEPGLALEDAKLVLNQNKQDPDGWRLRALALQQRGDFEDALEAIDKALELGDASDYESRLIRAQLLASTRGTRAFLEEAAALEAAGLQLTPLLRLRAKANQDPATAQQLSEELARREPNDPARAREQAVFARERGAWEQVQQHAELGNRLARFDLTCATLLLEALIQTQHWKQAIEHAQATLGWAPPGATPWLQAQLAYALCREDPVENRAKIETLTTAFRKGQSGARTLLYAQAILHQTVNDPVATLQWLHPLSPYPGEPTYPVEPDSSLLLWRSNAERSLRLNTRAHTDLTDLLKLERDRRDMGERGETYLRQGLPWLAHSEFASGTQHPHLQGSRAAALLFMQQPRDAAVEFNKVANQLGLRSIAFARALRLGGNPAGALKVLQGYFRNQTPPGASAEEAEAHLVTSFKLSLRKQIWEGKIAQVGGTLDELLLLEPYDPELRVLVVALASWQADTQLMSNAATRLLERSPNAGLNVLTDLAAIAQAKRPELSALLYSEILGRAPGNQAARTSAVQLLTSLGLFESADRVASEGLARGPDPALQALRGIARAKGRRPGAAEDLRPAHAANLRQLGEPVSLELGKLLSREGAAPDEVLAVLERAEASRVPTLRASAQVYLAKALAERAQGGDSERARKLLETVADAIRRGTPLAPDDCAALTEAQLRCFEPR